LTTFMSVEPQGEPGSRYLLIPWIGEYIAAMYKYAIGITGVLAGIMIVIAGLIWLTAGGSAERVSTAKSFIEGALVGLVIALTSYVLLYAINPTLTGFDALKVKFVERVAPFGEGGGMEATGEIAPGGRGSAQDFRAISCDGLATGGEEFDAFFTSYYLPKYGETAGHPRAKILTNPNDPASGGENDPDPLSAFYCAVSMQMGCFGIGSDSTKRCYGGGVFARDGARHGWAPCKPMAEEAYQKILDNKMRGTVSDGSGGRVAKWRGGETVAADCNCFKLDGSCKIEVTFRDGTKKVLQLTDSGTGIRGRRFDFFAGLGRASYESNKMSGSYKVKLLPGCQQAAAYGQDRGSACPWRPPPPGPLGPQPAGTTTSIPSTGTGEKIAVIGDSITVGTQYQNYLRSNCTGKSIEVFARVGAPTSEMLNKFRDNVKGKGFKGLIILGGVNDLASGRTVLQIQNNLNIIYTEAKADGLKVTAVTVLPWKGYDPAGTESDWTSSKQTQTENLNSWILGSPADIKVNAYASFGDASDPAKLKCAYDGRDGTCGGDHIHPNATGSTALGAAVVGAGACR
jgi:lysophospholipase L1-like esterase